MPGHPAGEDERYMPTAWRVRRDTARRRMLMEQGMTTRRTLTLLRTYDATAHASRR